MPAFQYTFDESFLIETFRRYRQSRSLARFTKTLKILLGVCLLVLIIVSTLLMFYIAAIVLALFFTMLLLAVRIDDWLLTRRFRKSPYYGDCIQIDLSADGMFSEGTKSSGKVTWTVFTKARRFADGFLLFQGPQVLNWLPIKSITAGTPKQVDELIRANIADYEETST